MTFAITRRAALALAGATAAAGVARAQTVNRTARIVIGFPPGGSSDVVARLYAEKLRGRFAPQVIVDGRPGAAGRIAVEAVKAGDADGTVILQTPASMLTVQPHVFPREVRYDALTDFIPVSTVCSFPFGFGVPMNHPARTLDEWIAWSRAQPNETPWASPAAGSVPHFTGIMLGRKLNLRLTHVPYRGGAPAVADVIGGRLPLFIGVLSEMLPHEGTGLRILAVTSATRFAKIPNVPTLAELGHPERTAEEWFGALVPAGDTRADRGRAACGDRRGIARGRPGGGAGAAGIHQRDLGHAAGLRRPDPARARHVARRGARERLHAGMSAPPREIRLNAFDMACVGHIQQGMWTHPRDRATDYLSLSHWTSLARTLERGLFDGLFLADVLGVYDVHGGSQDAAVRARRADPAARPDAAGAGHGGGRRSTWASA